MNYIEQIKGFWLTQEMDQLGISEIAMYFYMLEVWNKTAWRDSFRRNNAKAQADLGIKSYKTFNAIRIRLQAAGILSFDQMNGISNVEYIMHDLSKFYKGSGKGSEEGLGKGVDKGSEEGLGKGSGVVKINTNQTKPNQTSSSIKPFWNEFIKAWVNFFEKENQGSKYELLPKDFSHLKKIYELLLKRISAGKNDFEEKDIIAAFNDLLQKAWEKDSNTNKWLQNNFTPSNILSQYNSIINGNPISNTTTRSSNKQEAGFSAFKENLTANA